MALLICIPAFIADAQTDSFIRGRPDFVNWLFDPTPTAPPGASLTQPGSIAIFSGNIGNPTNAAPNDGQIHLVQSQVGGVFAAGARSLEPPVILTQPQSLTVASGANATFTVSASGTEPVIYQWRKNGVDLLNETNATLALIPATTASAGSYAVLVSNALGSATSSAATLTIHGTAVTPANLNTTWILANSPYVVATNVIVTNLTIEPGVTVLFDGSCQLEVRGPFRAVGASNNPIRFTASLTNWDGVYFNGATGALEMSWCIIERSVNSGIRIHDCSPALRFCTIRDNSGYSGGGIWTDRSLTLESCEVANNRITTGTPDGGGGIFSGGGTLTLRHCSVRFNEASGCCATVRGGGIQSAVHCVLEDSEVLGNRIVQPLHGNSGGGIHSEGLLECYRTSISSNEVICARNGGKGGGVSALGDAIFSQCVLQGNIQEASEQSWGGAVYCQGTLSMTNCLMTGNRAWSCPPGSWVQGSALMAGGGIIENCTIAHNALAATAFTNQTAVEFEGVIRNSIVYFNTPIDQQIGPGIHVEYPVIEYSDVQGGWSGTGNTNADPLFINQVNYLLSTNSPCIDAGDPASAMEDGCRPPALGGTRNDMGAYGGPGVCEWPGLDAGRPRILVNGLYSPAHAYVITNATFALVEMQTSFQDGHIFYTRNGTPSSNSIAYHGPVAFFSDVTLRAIAYNSNYTASAEARPVNLIVRPVIFSVAIAGSGNVTISPQVNQRFFGQSLSLIATPRNANWTRFVRWSDGNTNNPRTITIGASNVLTAVFTNVVPLEELVFKQWDKSFGGENNDEIFTLQQTIDGGFILGGHSNSGADGNKASPNYGLGDFWVVRLDTNGEKLWDRAFGGTGEDTLLSLQQTADGGFILGGNSRSGANGNKSSPNFGLSDCWVVRLDANGNKLWDRSFGGNGNDNLTSVRQTATGEFILGAISGPSFGSYDFWVVELDANGNQLREQFFGGSGDDEANSLQQTADGGVILAGYAFSNTDGNKTSPALGGGDLWVVRLDASGNKLWDASFGGSDTDNAQSIQQTDDGGFIVGGYSRSGADGNKMSPGFGNLDYWVVRLDRNGHKLWDQSSGGGGYDSGQDVRMMDDGGFIVGGYSSSGAVGNKTSPGFGNNDFWVVRLDANGNKRWDLCFGGTGNDVLYNLQPTADGGLILGGHSDSGNGGAKTSATWGLDDFWVLRLARREAPIGTPAVLVNGSYNPTNSYTITNATVALVEMQTTFPGGRLFYTQNGSAPSSNSIIYTTPITYLSDATLRVIAYNSNFTASVEADPVSLVVKPITFSVANVGSGTVTVSPATNHYFIGQTVNLTAAPRNPNWTRFLAWSDGTTNNPRTINVGLSNVLTAIFTNFVRLEELVFKQWEISLGGTEDDAAQSIRATADGGFLVAGSSYSGISGNKTSPNSGHEDLWVVKLDADRRKIWDKSFGESGRDSAYGGVMVLTSDDGCIVGGSYNNVDCWLLRLDANGNTRWENRFAGGAVLGIETTSDGGLLVVAVSETGVAANKTSAYYGSADFWVIRLDAGGNEVWENSFGGSGADYPYSVTPSPDGGYLIGGYSDSPVSGNKTNSGYGGDDFWVVKVDGNGNKLWDRSYGGSQSDRIASLMAMGNGRYVVGGTSRSGASGIKTTPNFGVFDDFWVIQIDDAGNLLGQNSFGGDNQDFLFRITPRDDGTFLLGGASISGVGGTKTSPNFGDYRGGNNYDYWVAQIDSLGNQRWDQSYGGTLQDYLLTATATTDHGYALAGMSWSEISGNKTSPVYGEGDFWVLKLATREAPIGTPVVLVNGQYSPSNRFDIPATNAISITLQTSFANAELYYTTDGSDPAFATLYTGPITNLAVSTMVRAFAFDLDTGDYQEADPVQVNVPLVFPLTVSSPGGGSVSIDIPGGAYISNTVVTLTAVASNGWTFMRWAGDAGGTVTNLPVLMNRTKDIQAIFGTPLFSTNIPANFGSTLRQPEQTLYEFGQSVRLSAVPAAGRYFTQWGSAASGILTSPLRWSVTAPTQTVRATYSTLPANTFSLTVLINGDGAVTRIPQQSNHLNGSSVVLTGTPDADSVFGSWSGDAAGTANPLNVLMNTNKTITANFTKRPTVRLVSPTNGATFTTPLVEAVAEATDPDGLVQSVDVFLDGRLTGTLAASPYRLALSNLFHGEHVIDVRATDNQGATASSEPVSFFVQLQPPVIQSFTPRIVSVGSVLEIHGENFSPVSTNNHVFLGAARATVALAATNRLTVVVPSGATYGPISVTTLGLSGYSRLPCVPTFAGGSNTQFSAAIEFGGLTDPRATAIGDFDLDGRPDLIVSEYGGRYVVYRNQDATGVLDTNSFQPGFVIQAPSAVRMSVGDLDGDGWLDLVAANLWSHQLTVFRNLGPAGDILTNLFAPAVALQAGVFGPKDVKIADLDADGRPDLIAAGSDADRVIVFRNIGVSGQMTTHSFAAPVGFPVGDNPSGLTVGDVDGDGRPDIAVANGGALNVGTVSVLRNLTTPGGITSNSFAAPISFDTFDFGANGIALTDLDGDEKLDLAVVHYHLSNCDKLVLFRNTGTTSEINSATFAPAIAVECISGIWDLAVGDLTGDGRPDLISASEGTGGGSLFYNRNLSGAGAFLAASFPRISFASTKFLPGTVAVADLDGDGRPELVTQTGYGGAGQIEIFQNFTDVAGRAPDVALLLPRNGEIFVAPANILLSAALTNTGGTFIARVEFFAGASLIGSDSTPPYQFTWTNVPPGNHTLFARWVDALGPGSNSAPVTVTVLPEGHTGQGFHFHAVQYATNESAGFAIVTVEREPGGPDVVNYRTENGTASAVRPDYLFVAGALTFSNGAPMELKVPLVDNCVIEGSRAFQVQLLNETNGLAFTTATITITDNDTLNSPCVSYRTPDAAIAQSNLRITLVPTTNTGWRFAWEHTWRASGSVAAGLTAGLYPIVYKPVQGYEAPSEPGELSVSIPANTNIVLTAHYIQTGVPQTGRLTVVIEPPSIAGTASWSLAGEPGQFSNGYSTNLPLGSYVVVPGNVNGWNLPSPVSVAVSPTEQRIVTLRYEIAESWSGGGNPATPEDIGNGTYQEIINALPGLPYGWNGQIVSDLGRGSGVVVRDRVVLTAAHVVWDETRGEPAANLRWFFQRHTGEFEPIPLVPRGVLLLTNYPFARSNDLASGGTNGIATPESRRHDIAVLYFDRPAGRAGFNGYLVSSKAANTWLLGSFNKMLVGYPTEGPGVVPGKIHATPQPAVRAFTTSGDGVYQTADIRGFAGNSGGPLCVQPPGGVYYPAGVFLGSSASVSYVRGIDDEAARLINLAAALAVSEESTNQLDPSLLRIDLRPTTGGGLFRKLFVNLEPPAATNAGARWNLLEMPGHLTRVTNQLSSVQETRLLHGTNYQLTFSPANGYLTPPPYSLTITGAYDLVITATYHVPRLQLSALGIDLIAPTGRVYDIQRSVNLSAWSNWFSVTPTSTTINVVPAATFQRPQPAQEFYRVRAPQ